MKKCLCIVCPYYRIIQNNGFEHWYCHAHKTEQEIDKITKEITSNCIYNGVDFYSSKDFQPRKKIFKKKFNPNIGKNVKDDKKPYIRNKRFNKFKNREL